MDKNAATTIHPPPQIFSSPSVIENYAVKEFHQLGTITLADRKKLGIYEIKTKSKTRISRNRVRMRHIVAKECRKNSEDGALAVYYHDDENLWRFSFISMEYKIDGGRVIREESSPKRYTYLLGKSARIRTAIDRFSQLAEENATLENLKTAFGVEQLNKEFYKKLFDWYTKAKDSVVFPNDTVEEDNRSISLIRLLTRLLFIWFIKEKGLINPDFFDENKVRQLIFWNKDSSYYKAILQNLFFATLNREINERRFCATNCFVTNAYRYKNLFSEPDEKRIINLFKQTPFLNGGLFECLDRNATNEEQHYDMDKIIIGERQLICIDSFSDREDNPLHVPNELFFNNDDESPGLINLLKQYQFTVEESTPIDVAVALDPELLGLVFEKLLDDHNLETKESTRRETGSYYTPREIVNYMVDESLKAYLTQTVPPHDSDIDFYRECLDELFVASSKTDEITGENGRDLIYKEEIPKLIEAIKKIKILDPAVGSGAFPMGVLHRLVSLLNLLDPNRENDFERKLYLIENAIYGVDIQLIAIHIVKLRFFISLVIEQEPTRNPAENYGIKPLPNLETKFTCADSLIGLYKPKQLNLENPDISQRKKELKYIRQKYFTAKTIKTKQEYKERDKTLRNKLAGLLREDGWKNDTTELIAKWDPYDQNSSARWFDAEHMFGIEDSFDLVIGNPPYVQLQKNSGKLGNLYQNAGYKTFNRTGDIYQLFYEKGCKMLKNNAHLCYITSNKWMGTVYGKKTRNYFATETNPIKLLDFNGCQVFENATVDTNILLIQKAKPKNELQATRFKNDFKKDDSIKQYVERNAVSITVSDDTWVIGSSTELNIIKKLKRIGIRLSNWEISIKSGIKTGYNDAFIINTDTKDKLVAEDPNSADIIKPVLRGENIKRYRVQWTGEWLISTHNGYNNIPAVNINDYPAVKNHLDKFYHQLAKRQDKGKTLYNLRNCTYYEKFTKEKLFFPDIADKGRFTYDNSNLYGDVSTLLMTGNSLKYLCAVLNAKLISWFFHNNNPGLGSSLRWRKKYMEDIPIPQISNLEQQPFIKLVEKILKTKTFKPEADTSKQEAEIDQLVYKLYKLTEVEIRTIEKKE